MTDAERIAEWQPIGSAPKDGTVIVVAAPEYGEQHVMQWGHIQTNALLPGTVGMWVHQNGAFTWDDSRGFGPTHWKPLDAPA